jgi:hypothetical protein
MSRLLLAGCIGCFAGSALAVDDAAPAPPLPGASPAASPVPTPPPAAAIPKAAPETENTDVNATQAPDSTMEQAPQPAEDATPADEAQREGLLQPESGLDQQIS